MKSYKKANLSALLLGAIIFITINFSIAGTLSINPSSGTQYKDCYTPFKIIMDTVNIETTAVDSKIFHEDYFLLNTGDYTIYITWVMDNTTLPLLTGTTWWNTYLYVNTTQNLWNSGISWSDLRLITLYMAPQGDADTSWYITFHFYTGSASLWINSDDSNITSGINNFTQTIDVLTSVTNWEYYITGNQYCPYKPYIQSWEYRQDTYVATATWVIKTRTGITAGPSYTNVGDDQRNEWTMSTWRTTWTNTSVLLNLTWNENIQIISIQMFDDPNISASGEVRSGRTDFRQFIITGNILTGYVTFDNILNNDWNTYQTGDTKYVYGFNIDAFWIDTVNPNVLTSSIITWAGFVDVTLFGQLSTWASNATSGRHKSDSEFDDQFTIYQFSGNNKIWYWYNTTTEYNTSLINTYGGLAGSWFTMEKDLHFTQSRSGDVLYIDRAWNTGFIFLDIDIETTTDFIIYAQPAFRENAGTFHGRSGLATTWDLWIAYRTWWIGTTRQFIHNSVIANDAKVTLNSNGTGTINIAVPVSWCDYLVAFKWTGMLSIWFTGTWTNDIFNTSTNFFNFRSGTLNEVNTLFPLFPEHNYWGINYIKAWDVSYTSTGGGYDIINSLDLAAINWSLIVWVGTNIRYDFDLNDTISAIEQSIIIQYDLHKWFIDTFWNQTWYPIKVGNTWFVTFQ